MAKSIKYFCLLLLTYYTFLHTLLYLNYLHTVQKKVMPILFASLVVILGFGLFASTAHASSTTLLVEKTVTNATPAPGDSFFYLIRYRCASLTDHCIGATMTDAIPSDLTILSYSGAGGNVKAVNLTGSTLTWDLESVAGTIGAPPGALAAGSAGLLKVRVRFPSCGTQSPAAGVNLDNQATFAATVGGVAESTTSTAGSALVTTPVIPACPTPPTPTTGLSKSVSNGQADYFQPGGLVEYRLGYPTNGTALTTTWTLTETVPAGLSPVTFYNPTGTTTLNARCPDGNTYEIYSNTTIVNTASPATSVMTFTVSDINGNPTGCTATRVSPGSTHFSFDIEAISFTIIANDSSAGQMWWRFQIDEDASSGTLRNCINGSDPSLPTPCADISVIDAVNPIVDPNKVIITHPGNSDPNVMNPNPLVDSSLPHTPNDVIFELEARNYAASGTDLVSPVIEDYLPSTLDFDPTNGNWWQIALFDDPGLNAPYDPYDQPACWNPVFTVTDIFAGGTMPDGQVILGDSKLLRWEFPGCVLPIAHWDYSRVKIYLSTRIKPGVDQNVNPGLASNYAWMSSLTSQVYCSGNSANGGGDTTLDDSCRHWGNGNYVGSIPVYNEINSSKWVKGALDAAAHRYPDSGYTNLDGDGSYEIILQNTGNVTETVIDVVDILPWVGDAGLVTNAARDSAWSEELAGPITIERYDPATLTWSVVPTSELNSGPLYAVGINPCRVDGSGQIKIDGLNPASCETLSAATAATGARSFGFRWTPVSPFQPNEQLRVTVPVRQLGGEADAPNGDIAWNSFGYTYSYWDPDLSSLLELPSTEPLKVGLEMIHTDQTAALGDRVWFDANGNGVQDAGEAGITGVRVNLYDSAGITVTDSAGNPRTTTTDANGNYTFWGLTPGTTYQIRLNDPNDHQPYGALGPYQLTQADQGSDSADSDATLNGNGYPEITATTGVAGSNTPTFDFGFTQPAAVGNYVWDDLDGDGGQGAGEPGVSGVTVNLLDASGSILLSTTTDANGFYLFDDLMPGVYSLEFVTSTLPISRTLTAANMTGNTETDSDADSDGRTAQFVLDPGERDMSFDAGLVVPPADPAAIEGRVWEDLDSDGLDNNSEPGVANIQVFLVNSAGLPVGSTYTDSNGEYRFDNLAPGVTYQVVFNPGPFYTVTNRDAGGDDTIDSDGDPATGETPAVTPLANQTISHIDLGVISKLSLGNLVWFDINNNGLVDAGESGIPGVTVRLLDGSSTVIMTTTTDYNGKYLFLGLDAGNYQVEIDMPAGYRSSTDGTSTGTPNQSDSDDNGIGSVGATISSATITLVANGGNPADANHGETDHGQPINSILDPTPDAKAYYTVDFGLYRSVHVGNRVWLDDNGDTVSDLTDNNGLFEPFAGESAIGNVVVEAWLDNGDNLFDPATDGATPGTADGSDTTDVNGEYYITDLAPGSYWIVVSNTNFNLGQPLYNLASSTGAGSPNSDGLSNDQYDDGNDTPQAGAIVANGLVTLTSGMEPQGETAATNDPGLIDADANWLVDFSFYPPPPIFELSKVLNVPSPVRINETISYTIRITNTGLYTITTLPLTDTYQTAYLAYVSATIAPDQSTNDGQLNWADIIASAGQSLAPNATLQLDVQFTAIGDTTGLPMEVTINQATVLTQVATATVTIVNPTAINIAEMAVSYVSESEEGAYVDIQWHTANETEIAGFYLYRQTGDEMPIRLVETPIVAQNAGQANGASYRYTDAGANAGQQHHYLLEILSTEGASDSLSLGSVLTGGQIFLPLVSR